MEVLLIKSHTKKEYLHSKGVQFTSANEMLQFIDEKTLYDILCYYKRHKKY